MSLRQVELRLFVIFCQIWIYFSKCSSVPYLGMLDFEKWLNMAEKNEKTLLNLAKLISPWHFLNPKPGFRVIPDPSSHKGANISKLTNCPNSHKINKSQDIVPYIYYCPCLAYSFSKQWSCLDLWHFLMQTWKKVGRKEKVKFFSYIHMKLQNSYF